MKKFVLRALLVGLVILVVSLLLSAIFNMVFPTLAAEYANDNLFRLWSDPMMLLYFIYPFVLSFPLVWLWEKTSKVWKSATEYMFAIWLVASIPGMLMSISSFQISLLMVTEWTLSGLIGLLCSGFVLEKFSKQLR